MVLTGLERILNSALTLYSKYGIKSITLDDLCKELGISKKTIYQFITDKKDLIRKVVDYEISIQNNSYKKMVSSDINAIDELLYVNRQIHENQGIHNPVFYYDLKKYYPDIYNEWMKYKRARMYELIHRNLEKGIAEGLYRKEMDAAVISRLHMARTELMHSSDIIDEKEFSNSHFINEIFRYHIHGICNEQGLTYFKAHYKEFNKKS
jgi:TetR/AcrR family transcriptional regulator, cholesterol catabolism regulator